MVGCGVHLGNTEGIHVCGYKPHCGFRMYKRGFWSATWAKCGIMNHPGGRSDYGLGKATLNDVIICTSCAKKLGVLW